MKLFEVQIQKTSYKKIIKIGTRSNWQWKYDRVDSANMLFVAKNATDAKKKATAFCKLLSTEAAVFSVQSKTNSIINLS
jgi:hypothetical protein